jgi:hypothetical protein
MKIGPLKITFWIDRYYFTAVICKWLGRARLRRQLIEDNMMSGICNKCGCYVQNYHYIIK